MAFSLRSVAHSEVGLVRTNNQDSAYVSGVVLAVADGMGGAAAGDLASTVAINRIAALSSAPPSSDISAALHAAVAAANDELAVLTTWNPALDGMGTTVDAAVLTGSQLAFEHIGDSRAYLLRAGILQRLTRDHSWVQQMIDSGQMSIQEAEQHPNRSRVTRIVNGHEEFRPEFFTLDLALNDRLLLCSDGLCGQVDESELQQLLATAELSKVSAQLIKAARAAGAPDNVTFIVADVVEQDDALDTVPGRLLGAAETLRVPQVPHVTIGGDTQLSSTEIRANGTGADSYDSPAVAAETDSNAEDIGLTTSSKPVATPRRSARVILIALVVVLAVIIGGGLFAVQSYLRQRFYLGPSDEVVAVYQGVPDQILGVPLAEILEHSDVHISDLPVYYAAQVRSFSLQADTLTGIEQTLDELRELATYCVAQRAQQPSPSNDPSSSNPSDNEISQTTKPSVTSSSQDATSTPTTVAPARPTSTIGLTWECP